MATSIPPKKSGCCANAAPDDPGSQWQEQRVWPVLHRAVTDAPVRLAVAELYGQLDDEVRRRGPVCWVSGRCCHFNAFGHRLWVTALEVAWVISQLDAHRLGPVDLHAPCPFQVDALCTVHAIRPMGCRLFFCQQGTSQWQGEVYERFLLKLRGVHERFELPYLYLEWREGLVQALESDQPTRACH